MEKAILSKPGKGWLLTFEDEKKMPFNWSNLPSSLEGSEVSVRRERGQPVEIVTHGGERYTKPAQQQVLPNQGEPNRDQRTFGRNNEKNQRARESYQPKSGQSSGSQKTRHPARAPYNFVPLNNEVVGSSATSNHDHFAEYNGYLDVELEAKNPLFVRGHDGNFFRVNDTPYLPGSSIRGLVRTMTEIVAYGKLQFFNDRQLYTRSNMTEHGNNVLGGFLKLENEKYSITPATFEKVKNSGLNNAHEYRFGNNSCTFSTGKFKDVPTVWEFTKNNKPEITDGLSSVVSSYQSDDTRSEDAIDIVRSLKKGKIVNHMDKSINQDTPIPDSLGVPVFYRIGQENKVISIGHAKYHRIPYDHSIGDHIKQKQTGIDLATSIFGTDSKAGKIYVEDCAQNNSTSFVLNEPRHPKILSSPKPTTYQHYLEQPNGIQTNQLKLSKWSTLGASIRGWKCYWHKKTSNNERDSNSWIESGPIQNSHPNPINPIGAGSKFKGRIRFQNLSAEELGALLFALDLPEGCAHKLGMGKPLGLGSVRITPKLVLIDRADRYKNVFNADGTSWHKAEQKLSDFQSFKDVFAKYIGSQLGCSQIIDCSSYWANDSRMKALQHMLKLDQNIDDKTWEHRTRYMEIRLQGNNVNEYKEKLVLPSPAQVVEKDTYPKP